MLYFYTGTNREKVRKEMNNALKPLAKGGARLVRITDANTLADLRVALMGEGMFGEKRIIVLEDTIQNEEMQDIILASLNLMRGSPERFFIFEGKPDANTRKAIEKHAERSERFDAPKKKEDKSIFLLGNALRRADKKALWVGYQKELARGKSPESIHGVLFWGAKDMLLRARKGTRERSRAQALVAGLAELPHEARRNNLPLEYALERFVLSAN